MRRMVPKSGSGVSDHGRRRLPKRPEKTADRPEWIESNSPEEGDSLVDAIKEFINQSEDGLFEDEIHSWVFFADLYCTERYGARITEAEFKPFMYGPYSENIVDALEHLDHEVKTKQKTKDGQKAKKFYYKGITSLEDGKRFVIRDACDLIQDQEMDENDLRKVGKFNWLFQETDFSDVINTQKFRKYREELEANHESPIILVEIGPLEDEQVPDSLIPLSSDYEKSPKMDVWDS